MAEILLAGAPWGAAGRGAVAEILLPGRAIGKILLARSAVAELLAGSCRKALRHKKESDP